MKYLLSGKILLSFVALCIIALMAMFTVAQGKETHIIVTGMADGITAKSRDVAIDDALRQAVEQAVGSFLSSETLVENMKLVEERIFTETRGYISKYEIIKDYSKGNTYHVQVSAQVKTAQLTDDLTSIGLLINKKHNPRVMVVLFSKEMGVFWFEYVREGNRTLQAACYRRVLKLSMHNRSAVKNRSRRPCLKMICLRPLERQRILAPKY
jgi:hypothetical protein